MRHRWPIVALLAGAALLGAAFLGNLAAIEASTARLTIFESSGRNENVTFHAYHVTLAPGDTLVIPPNLYTGRFVYMAVVEGGETAYIERGERAPHTYLKLDPPAFYSTYVDGKPTASSGVYVDSREHTLRLERPPRPAEVPLPINGTRWEGLDANGLDIVYWVPRNATPQGPANATEDLLLHPLSSHLGSGDHGLRTIRGWLPEVQIAFYLVEGAATLATVAGVVGLLRAAPAPEPASGLEAYARLARRADAYVRELRLLLVGSGVLFLVLGAFGLVAIVSVFDHLAYAHAFPAWRLPLALMALIGFSALVAGWAIQAARVHREVVRLQSSEPPPLP